MRFRIAFACLPLLVVAVGCQSTDTTCKDLGNCAAPDSGADAAGGAAGTGGQSGIGGSAGASATGGSSGVSGTAGGGAAGMAGAGDAGPDTPPCDPLNAPSEDACVVDDQYGVFVAPTGSTGAAGTMADPVPTLAEGLAAAATAGVSRVYVCNATYAEQLSLTAAADGIEIYGGLECPGGAAPWAYTASAKPLVKPSAPGTALRIDGVPTSARIEDVAFEALDAVGDGASSIGAWVTQSTGVTLRRVAITAGDGVKGADGSRTDFVFPTQNDLNGNAASGGTGGASKVCDCPAGDQTSGGVGGNANVGGQAGGIGSPDHGAGQGGTPGPCAPDGTGRDGNPAPSATNGTGATTLGSLTTIWTPAPGDDGAPGGPGQGGGGGASTATAGGGGGGCGGCGGAAGPGGQGGGASIALVSIDSTVTIEDSALGAGAAGDGGNGATGQAAQTETGFLGNGTPPACSGGNGGSGAAGGSGGGGAGGVSLGILHKGGAPTTTSTSLVPGAAGTRGLGGSTPGNDGIDGVSMNAMMAP